MSPEDLYAAARAAAEHAHAPYSGLRVGAALEAASGAVYPGVNVENASYRLATCAEQAALARAVTDGERAFTRIAVARADGAPIVPCGACRQTLAEFGAGIVVVMDEGAGIVQRPLSDLLPDPFAFPR
ncbi:MAG: cytidine deaminase [Miltoncostaeaceae bacterium]|jgi:cytidine deaminase|nr:cytidine deaminase [Miltoncostaeaceae bacterium]